MLETDPAGNKNLLILFGERKKMSLKNLVHLMVVLVTVGVVNANIANFDDLTLNTAESYWNGQNGSAYAEETFTSGSAAFNNYHGMDTTWGYSYWGNFAYSNRTDTTSTGMAGQYSAIAGGADSGQNYGIVYVASPVITFANTTRVDSIAVTNNNYAYYSMLNGDSFAKKFGGDSGNDADWFLLTITGKNISGNVTGTVNFYLADYRFTNNGQDYIINNWTDVDLTSLGTIKSLQFALSSSDNSSGYMNTPAYFAIDNVVPEPMTIILLGLGGLLLRSKK